MKPRKKILGFILIEDSAENKSNNIKHSRGQNMVYMNLFSDWEERSKNDTPDDWLSFKDLEFIMIAALKTEKNRHKKIEIDFVTFWRLISQSMKALDSCHVLNEINKLAEDNKKIKVYIRKIKKNWK